MALTPNELDTLETLPETAPVLPSRTYGFDPITGEFTNTLVDGKDAIRQFIIKTLLTSRYKHLCYDHSYGSELRELIGEDVTLDYLENEIPRIVKDALIYDERIEDVTDISVQKERDMVTVIFTVQTTDGDLLHEEVVV